MIHDLKRTSNISQHRLPSPIRCSLTSYYTSLLCVIRMCGYITGRIATSHISPETHHLAPNIRRNCSRLNPIIRNYHTIRSLDWRIKDKSSTVTKALTCSQAAFCGGSGSRGIIECVVWVVCIVGGEIYIVCTSTRPAARSFCRLECRPGVTGANRDRGRGRGRGYGLLYIG